MATKEVGDFFGQVLHFKSLGRFEEAFSLVLDEIINNPGLFSDANTWARVMNQPEIFNTLRSHEENVLFVSRVMDVLQKIYLEVDSVIGRELIDSFLAGAQFRLTTHSFSNLKQLMAGRASLINSSRFVANERDFIFPTAVNNPQTPKIGIYFRHLMPDPETTSLIPLVARAKEFGIEVVIFTLAPHLSGMFGDHVLSISSEIVVLSDSLEDNLQVVREADLDILIYGNDVTAKLSMGARLSFHRIARIAITAVSTIATTASPYVDIYLGSSFHADRGAAHEFTEEFFVLPEPGFTFSHYSSSSLPVNLFSIRQQLNLGAQEVIFVSGANRTKLHNSLLDCWAKVLQAVPDSRLILYPFPPHFGPTDKSQISRLLDRFTLNQISNDRVFILPQLRGPEDVKGILRQADIGLDSFPYPGVTTIVDALESNLPTVTLGGGMLRNNQGAALLSCAGFSELIASDIDKYVQLCVRLAVDSTYRNNVRKRLESLPKSSLPFFRCEDFGKAAVDFYYQLHASLKSRENKS